MKFTNSRLLFAAREMAIASSKARDALGARILQADIGPRRIRTRITLNLRAVDQPQASVAQIIIDVESGRRRRSVAAAAVFRS
jgi:hypothetical protein